MDNDWDFYALLVEDRPASIFVDLALAGHAPLTGAVTMAYISVEMRAPRPDGLSSQDELDDLVAVEQSLEANLIDGAIYVGRCTTAGCRDFYFYVADVETFSASAVAAMAGSIHHGDASRDVTVDFKRVDAPAEIERAVIPVFDLVQSLSGAYDGWGCGVEKGGG